MNRRIILASASPRRRQLLTQVGLDFEVVVSNADETVSGTPAEQVVEVAKRKADAVAQSLANSDGVVIIAADTLVYANGTVLGKPESPEQAYDMLCTLQGSTHEVYTGVVMRCHSHANETREQIFFDRAQVTFRLLSHTEILAYIATGEPFDKAGAYGIQEKGAALVDSINGDFYTVMGLPIAKVCKVLLDFGVEYWS